MKLNRIFLVAGLCAAGFLCGFAGKRLSGDGQPAAPDKTADQGPARTRSTSRDGADTAAGTKVKAAPVKPSTLRSTDTLETLAELNAESLYSRLALWMMDASEQDIAAYWETVREKKDRTNDITDLVFINWARLNPQGAIAAVAGTANEHYAWWAWACHDPQGSLTAALAANPDRVNNVAWGLGEFQAEWLRAHWDQIPEAARSNAIRGMTKWDDTDQPLEVLEFIKANGNNFNRGIFTTLIRKDPWAAYDWMQQNESTITNYYGSKESVMKLLVDTMAESQPDALQRLADQTPSGELKRRMETALFENLVQTDPDAALEQAKATKAPVIAAERLATVGVNLVKTDPDKAFEIAKDLFAANPGAMSVRTVVKSPNGSTSWGGSSNEKVGELVNALMAKDPAKVMSLQPPPGDAPGGSSSDFGTFTQMWAQQDLVGYTNWVNQQTDPKIREVAVNTVASQLMNEQQYSEAAEWMMSSERSRGNMINLIYQWNRSNPAEAREWLDSADLPEKEKTRLNQFLKQNP
jgi:hypothetical protein